MDQKVFSGLKVRFDNYVKTFQSEDPNHQQNIDLKENHCRRVSAEILEIGKSLDLNNSELCTVEIMALFHDIGRFEQYTRYGTFSDAKSENHAELGVKVLRENGILKDMDPTEKEIMLKCIGYHNCLDIPENESQRCIFFTKLLRDADKLDIWRIMIEYYYQNSKHKNETIVLDLPDIPEISEEICAYLMAGRIARMSNMKTLNDFKLLQMGWIFDVNFKRTFQLVRQRGYLKRIRDMLPQWATVSEIYSKVESFLEEKCRVE